MCSVLSKYPVCYGLSPLLPSLNESDLDSIVLKSEITSVFRGFVNMGRVSGFLGGNLSPAQRRIAFDQKLSSASQLTAVPFTAAVLVLLWSLSQGN